MYVTTEQTGAWTDSEEVDSWVTCICRLKGLKTRSDSGASRLIIDISGAEVIMSHSLYRLKKCVMLQSNVRVRGAPLWAHFLLTYLFFFFFFLINTVMCCVQPWFDSQPQDFYQVMNTTQTWQWWFVCSWWNSCKPPPCLRKANSHTDYVSLWFNLSYICT